MAGKDKRTPAPQVAFTVHKRNERMTVLHMTLAELANLDNQDTENKDHDHPICGEFPHEIVINGWDYVGWE